MFALIEIALIAAVGFFVLKGVSNLLSDSKTCSRWMAKAGGKILVIEKTANGVKDRGDCLRIFRSRCSGKMKHEKQFVIGSLREICLWT